MRVAHDQDPCRRQDRNFMRIRPRPTSRSSTARLRDCGVAVHAARCVDGGASTLHCSIVKSGKSMGGREIACGLPWLLAGIGQEAKRSDRRASDPRAIEPRAVDTCRASTTTTSMTATRGSIPVRSSVTGSSVVPAFAPPAKRSSCPRPASECPPQSLLRAPRSPRSRWSGRSPHARRCPHSPRPPRSRRNEASTSRLRLEPSRVSTSPAVSRSS